MGLTASAALQSAPRKERGTVGWRREREEMRETDGSQRSNNVDFGNSDDDGKRLRQDGNQEHVVVIQASAECKNGPTGERCPNGGTKTNGMHRQA